MNTGKKLALVLAATLIMGPVVSCTSTGQYMPLSRDETVIGTVQTTFAVRSSLFSFKSAKDAVNTEAYIMLMEAAGKKYPGNIDVRDIEWVTGRSVDMQNTEIAAIGKVVEAN